MKLFFDTETTGKADYGFKWPKLTEAFRHFIGKDMEGAHDALADVRGCAAVFFAFEKMEADRIAKLKEDAATCQAQ